MARYPNVLVDLIFYPLRQILRRKVSTDRKRKVLNVAFKFLVDKENNERLVNKSFLFHFLCSQLQLKGVKDEIRALETFLNLT